MRRLFVPQVLGIFFFFSAAYAHASCDGRTGADKIYCEAMEMEKYCQTQNATISGRTCGGYGSNNNFNPSSATDQASLDQAFDSYIGNMKERTDQCCNSPSDGSCSDIPQAANTSLMPTTTAGGIPGSQATTAQAQRQTATHFAYAAGVCDANKKLCQDKANAAAAQSVPATCDGCTMEHLKDHCNSLAAPAQFMTTANQNFSQAEVADRQAAGTSSDRDAGKDGTTGKGGDATKDGTNGGSKKTSHHNSGLPMNPMSMLGPLMQALMQQPPQNTAGTQPELPQVASVNCAPGIISPECPAPAAPAATSDSWNKTDGQSNFQVASANNSAFNPADGPTPGTGKTGVAPVAGDPNAQPIPTTQVPNGGGQMPGGQQGAGAASLGGGGGGGGAMQTASTHLPDANRLTSHSQFAGTNQGISTAVGGSAGGYNYGGRGDSGQPMNYADWLPKTPSAARALAGGNMRPMQIQSKEVNIWTRISDHIKSRCALGLLRDCVP